MKLENKPKYQSNYRAEIDGLRAFAVLSVFAFHAFPGKLKGGFIGVDIFFVISGFLITSHILEKLDKGEFSFLDFFQRRIRRIFPSLIAVLSVSLVFGWFVLLSDEHALLGKHIASGAVFISNFVFADEAGYFDTAQELKPMLHLWSLAVEEQFYILWPLVLWIAWKLNFNLFVLTLIVFSASFLANIVWVDIKPTETFFWPFGRFWELFSGSLLAWFMVSKQKHLSYQRGMQVWTDKHTYHKVSTVLQPSMMRNLSSLFGMLLLALGVLIINKELPFPSFWALLPIFGALLVIYGGSQTRLSRLFLTNRLSIWFGLISYPLYLWHWPILSYLHIIEDMTPHRNSRIAAVFLSIFLAWVTYIFVEKPIRFGKLKEPIRTLSLIVAMTFVGAVGFIFSNADFKESKTVDSVLLRKRLEHRIGSSNRWYEGKDDWLFLGNSYNRTVEKLKLAIEPKRSEVEDIYSTMSQISESAARSNTKVALLVGPNKSTIYSEYLPTKFKPSPKRYFGFFAEALADIPNLILHDPTDDLLRNKHVEGKLYYRTDTHWNNKGAFLAYGDLLKQVGSPIPKVSFSLGSSYKGDLVGISKLEKFPLHADDNWNFTIDQNFNLERQKIQNLPLSEAFGEQEVVVNSNPLSNMRVWVVGDSFTRALKPYIESTFREVNYLGHLTERLRNLSSDLDSASKPDLVIIVRVERSF